MESYSRFGSNIGNKLRPKTIDRNNSQMLKNSQIRKLEAHYSTSN